MILHAMPCHYFSVPRYFMPCRAIIFGAKIFQAVPCHKSAGPRVPSVPRHPCQIFLQMEHPSCPKCRQGCNSRKKTFLTISGALLFTIQWTEQIKKSLFFALFSVCPPACPAWLEIRECKHFGMGNSRNLGSKKSKNKKYQNQNPFCPKCWQGLD